MRTHSSDNTIYLGRNAGCEILHSIKNAKHSLKIVSPYLTPTYVDALVDLAKKGKDITLLTSDDLKQGDGRFSRFSHKDIIKQKRITDEEAKRKREVGMKISMLSYSLLIVYFFIPIPINLKVALSTVSILISTISFIGFKTIRVYSYKYYTLLKLRVVYSHYNKEKKGSHLVHSKIFVIDDQIAYVGSTNFTYSGMVKNYESAVKVKDIKAVKRISKEVDSLFKDPKTPHRDITEWGKELYLELRN